MIHEEFMIPDIPRLSNSISYHQINSYTNIITFTIQHDFTFGGMLAKMLKNIPSNTYQEPFTIYNLIIEFGITVKI